MTEPFSCAECAASRLIRRRFRALSQPQTAPTWMAWTGAANILVNQKHTTFIIEHLFSWMKCFKLKKFNFILLKQKQCFSEENLTVIVVKSCVLDPMCDVKTWEMRMKKLPLWSLCHGQSRRQTTDIIGFFNNLTLSVRLLKF